METRYWPDASLRAQVDGSGAATRYYPDSVGRLDTVIDPLGRASVYGHDGVGNVTTEQGPGGNCRSAPKEVCTTYGYDGANQLTSVTYSDATTPNVTSVGYDASGARTSMTQVSKATTPVTSTSTWEWDSLGRLVSSTDANGATVGYGHDLRGAVASIACPGANKTVTRGYDDAGRWTSVTDWLGTRTRSATTRTATSRRCPTLRPPVSPMGSPTTTPAA